MILGPRQTVEAMGPRHPIARAILIMRAWFLLMAAMLVWNGFVATDFLLHGWVRPLPFFLLAVTSIVWSAYPWDDRIVTACTATITVGMVLRGMEVMIFATQFPLNARFTGASLWFVIGGTTLLIGVLNLIVTLRRTTEE